MGERRTPARGKDPVTQKHVIRKMIQDYQDDNPGAADLEIVAYLLTRGVRRDRRSVANHRKRIREEIERHERLDTSHMGDDEKDVLRDLEMLDEYIIEAANDRVWSAVSSLIARKHDITKPAETWKKKLSDDRAAVARKVEVRYCEHY